MQNVLCDECKKPMRKKGSTLNMGNSLFEVYICPSCGAEKKICIGVKS